MSSIQLEQVAKHWGSTTALSQINLSVAEGSFCVLLGPSGCGKSTTLRIIAGLDTPSEGRVLIDGRDVTSLPASQRGIAMVFQNYALFPHLNVADNITFGLSVRKVPVAERARRLEQTAELLGLGALLQRKPGQLSGGQQQRVALGRALVAQAGVCLMDEPLSNLDAQLRQEMRIELRELQQRLGLTVVYVTHDQAEAMSMADQVVVLNKGHIEQCDSPRQLYARPATRFVGQFLGTPAMNMLELSGQALDQLNAPAGAAWLGLRPEDIRTDGRISASIESLEYLGADLVLRCRVAGQPLMVRTNGQLNLASGQTIGLGWNDDAMHFFDHQGQRLSPPKEQAL